MGCKALIYNRKYRNFVNSSKRIVIQRSLDMFIFLSTCRKKLVLEEFNLHFRNLKSQRWTWKKPIFIWIYCVISLIYGRKLKSVQRELLAQMGTTSCFIFNLAFISYFSVIIPLGFSLKSSAKKWIMDFLLSYLWLEAKPEILMHGNKKKIL